MRTTVRRKQAVERAIIIATASSDTAGWTARRRRYVLLILSLIGAVNLIDRQIMSILIEPIRRDLHTSDTFLGLVTGFGFAVFYVLAGIPLARLADSGTRRSLLIGCMSIWSLATAACGMAQNLGQLALARVAVAAGEAGSFPASQSMLADLYPVDERGTVTGIIGGAQALGIAFGLLFGGLMSSMFGWRMAFLVAGLPGLALVLIVYRTVAEPPRGLSDGAGDDEQARPTLGEFARTLFRSGPIWLLLLVAISNCFAGYAILGWGATFLIRVHHQTMLQVGTWMGLATAGGLLLGNLLAGRIADLVARGDLAVYMRVAGYGTILAAPLGALFLLANNIVVTLLALFATTFCTSFWFAPTYAVASGLVPSRMRATMTAVIGLCMTLLGTGGGQAFVGVMNDILAPSYGQEAVRYSLLMVLCAFVLCALLCFAAARAIRRQVVSA